MMKRSVNTLVATAVMLLVTGLVAGTAAAQTTTIPPVEALVLTEQGPAPLASGRSGDGYSYAWAWRDGEQPQGPPEVRIFNDILKTTLQAVEAPELPELLKPKSAEGELMVVTPSAGTSRSVTRSYNLARSVFFAGEQEVSGFYMKGYGYLFTVRWPIRAGSYFGLESSNASYQRLQRQNQNLQELLQEQARGTSVGAETLAKIKEQQTTVEQAVAEQQQQAEERTRAEEAWRAAYRDKLVEALKEAVATYGHTLKQAAPEENITLLAEFDGEDPTSNVTLSVRRSALQGPQNAARTLAAIRVTKGDADVNPRLKRQVEIMTGILDTSFEGPEAFTSYIIAGSTSQIYTGGSGRSQYVPGYGVIFRKNARMNIMLNVLVPTPPAPASQRVETERRTQADVTGLREKSMESWAEHLATLKQKSAELLAIYGPTLTELPDEEWVAFYFNVGSGLDLLQGGMDYFLVQARMRDVREAGSKGDAGAAWLKDRLVTNEAPKK
jgi:hypothetical protein